MSAPEYAMHALKGECSVVHPPKCHVIKYGNCLQWTIDRRGWHYSGDLRRDGMSQGKDHLTTVQVIFPEAHLCNQINSVTPPFVDPPSPRGDRETPKGHPITLLASSRYMRARRRASPGSMTRNQNIVLRPSA